MKKNLLKRIGAVALAVAVSLTMGVTSFAATTPTRDGGKTSDDNSLTITKEIAYFNPQSDIAINYPAVEYTYSIAVADPGTAKVTAADSHTASVKKGVANGVVMDTDKKATFAAGSVEASTTGEIVSDTFGVKVDLTQFPAAGIYRYAINEEAPSNLADLGYEYATTCEGTRYLDVYIVNGDSGLKVGGYVLFYGDETSSFDSEHQDAKTTGFVHEADGDYSDDAYIDKYETYNVTLKKTVTGMMGDKTNLFPFNVSVSTGPSASNVTITGDIKTKVSSSPNASDITLSSGAASANVHANLANDDVAQFIGIPVGSTLSISETNNTADAYVVTASGLTGGPSNVSVAAGATSSAGTATTTEVTTIETGFTNNLENVSPTNVVMRFAPFLFIFGAAILLLVVMRRRKTQDAE